MNNDQIVELSLEETSDINGGYDLAQDLGYSWGRSAGAQAKSFLMTSAFRMRHYLSDY